MTKKFSITIEVRSVITVEQEAEDLDEAMDEVKHNFDVDSYPDKIELSVGEVLCGEEIDADED